MRRTNGYSAQPLFGGPIYFYPQPALSRPRRRAVQIQRQARRILVYHNTIIGEQTVGKPYSNAHFRNNLFLGRDMPNRGVMTWANATGDYSSDYNGFRPNRNVTRQYNWLAPAPGKTAYEPRTPTGRASPHSPSFRKPPARRRTASKSITISSKIWRRPTPRSRYHVYHSMDLNFRLKANSKAVDAGVVLPTINDGFTGKAPDLGALELDQPEPHYGPRWITWKPFYR